MSSPANAIEVLEDVLDSTGYELDEEQREVVADTVKQLSEDVEDLDGKAIQEAYDLIQVILKTDPDVYDEIACPVLELLKQRLGSSWRN